MSISSETAATSVGQATQAANAQSGTTAHPSDYQDAGRDGVAKVTSEPSINKLSTRSLVALGIGAAVIILTTIDQNVMADLLSLVLRALVAVVILYGLYNFVKGLS